MKKLGKLPPKLDHRTLKFSKYLVLPPVPQEVSWITKLEQYGTFPMYLNETIGDCTCAAAGHMIRHWNYYAGHNWQPTDADILKAYEDVSGYNPNDPSTDQGANMLDVLKYWRNVGIAGHKIAAFAWVDPANETEVRAAIQLFGSVYMGVALPQSVQDQNLWTVPDGGIYTAAGSPGSWGGHAIAVTAASPITRTCITWGDTLKMSKNFMSDYCDECYVVLSRDWIETNNISPSAFNWSQLSADLALL